MNTKISVVLATYNGAEYVGEQLLSIIKQTYNNFEIIIVDDCSHDETIGICKKLFEAEAFSNYRIFKNKKNIGPNLTFEFGIRKAQGKYIAISDQDDIWELNKLEILIDLIEKEDKNLVYAQSFIIRDQEKTTIKYPKQRHLENSFVEYLYNNARGATMLVLREFLLKIIPFSNYDLYDKWIYFACKICDSIGYYKEPLDYYRLHKKNFIGHKFKFQKKNTLINKLKNNIKFYQDLLILVPKIENENSKLLLEKINFIIDFFKQIIICLEKRSIFKCMGRYYKIVFHNPFNIKEKAIYFYYMILKTK